MIIDHPLLGPRDSAEFVYLGRRATDRPARPAIGECGRGVPYEYVYLRDNPAG